MRKETIAAIIIGATGVIIDIALLSYGLINQFVFLGIFVPITLVALAISGFDRLREVDIKNARITLDKVEQAKAEVFAKERELKAAAVKLLQMMLFNGERAARYVDDETLRLQRQWNRVKAREVVDAFSIDKDIANQLSKYSSHFEAFDCETDADKKKRLHAEYRQMIKDDIAEAGGG